MKLQLAIFLLLPLVLIAQKPMRLNPAVSVHDLKSAQTVNQLSPKLWQMMKIPSHERAILDDKLRFSIGFQVQNSTSYASLVTVVESELVATVEGMKMTAKGNGESLSDQQKRLIGMLKLGDEFDVKLKFKHNDKSISNKVVEAQVVVSVLPHHPADFNGGIDAFRIYLEKNILSVVRQDDAFGDLDNAKVTFQVNAAGKVSDVKLVVEAANEKTNQLIIQALNKMPNWLPARNVEGQPENQLVKYSFGGC